MTDEDQFHFQRIEIKLAGNDDLHKIGRPSKSVSEDKAAKLIDETATFLNQHFEQEMEFIRIRHEGDRLGLGLPYAGVISGQMIDELTNQLRGFLATLK